MGNYRVGILGNRTVKSAVLGRLPIVALRYSVCGTHVSDRPTRFTAPGPGGTAGLGHVTASPGGVGRLTGGARRTPRLETSNTCLLNTREETLQLYHL